jgi:hypothetical protein
MEPLNDDELNQLLARWKAPDAPASLAARVLPQRGPWWSWLLNGSIRIPVPIGVAIVAAIVIFWIYSSGSPREQVKQPAGGSVSLADFQPVKNLEPRVIGRANEGN